MRGQPVAALGSGEARVESTAAVEGLEVDGEAGLVLAVAGPGGDSAGWSRETMLRFLASVHVGSAAEPSVG
ncbi:MAG: hypothetical protein QM595_17785 [Nocardioides sp.]